MGYKWKNNVIFSEGKELSEFLLDYYQSNPQRKIIYLLGKGFDPRMTNGLRFFLPKVRAGQIDCLLIDFPSTNTPPYQELIDDNMKELLELYSKYEVTEHSEVSVDFSINFDLALRLLDQKLAKYNFDKYTDIIIDISAIPRSIFFNIIKTIFDLRLRKNMMVFVSENVSMDIDISEKDISEMNPIFGFKGRIGRASLLKTINISIPLIGEGKTESFKKIINGFDADDICPILPFPSSDLRRSDNLLWEYCDIFTNVLMIEAHNILYVDEKNPFELYAIINQIIQDYHKSLKPLAGELCFGISVMASKLLSLGALLVALDPISRNEVTIFNVNASEYTIKVPINTFIDKNKLSEPYLVWISGDAYE